MPAATREANANMHPGYIVLNAQKSKHTTKEVEDKKAWARAKRIAMKQDAAAEHRAIISTIAALKATVKRQEAEIQAHTNRPDLHNGSPDAMQKQLTQEVPVKAWKYTGGIHDSTG